MQGVNPNHTDHPELHGPLGCSNGAAELGPRRGLGEPMEMTCSNDGLPSGMDHRLGGEADVRVLRLSASSVREQMLNSTAIWDAKKLTGQVRQRVQQRTKLA